MFKKAVQPTSKPGALSGKDSKALKRNIQIRFPDLTDGDVQALFPAKAEIAALKLAGKMLAYTCNGSNPLFIDPDGRGESIFPSVYAMWICPSMLPAVLTYSEVSTKVLGGADLFLQGIIKPPEGLGEFSAGELRCVCIPQNPFPFAVGQMEVNSSTIQAHGMKGRGLKLLHHFHDGLWALGDKSVPSPSFSAARIFPLDLPSAGTDHPAIDAAAESLEAASLEDAQAPAELAQQDEVPIAHDITSVKPKEQRTAEQADCSEATGVPVDQDQLIEYCLLAGLHNITDEELPVLTSDFWPKFMYPARPAGSMVDIKKSSYKKLSKLLSVFEKKGLFKTKMIHKLENLTFVRRDHELYRGFNSLGPSTREAEQAAVSAPSTSGRVEVSYHYRVPSSLRPVFGTVGGANKDELFSEAQVREALASYADSQQLLRAIDDSLLPPGRVTLDHLLAGSLYNKKEPAQQGDAVDVEDVTKRLLDKLQLHHRVVRHTEQGAVEVVRKGLVRPITLALEDRHGGQKHVLRIAGVESFAIDPDELAATLARKLYAASWVTKLPGKAADTGKEIALQGNLGAKVAALLQSDYGVGPEHLEVKGK